MVCVVAIMAAENDRPLGLGMPELAMRALAAGHQIEPDTLQVRDQLPNLTWHTEDTATIRVLLPTRMPRELSERVDSN